ncbi:MAG: 2-amino-4-hydroxy-6-hydroxymethyldihydropteridine diphosphokinase [Propionibacteriaceae bacterium]|nr:2-amino-4-hydroxy-6-hydroxymethyldihydropteridine diphosphokinase [Propionibacteriaceae bacterium]
MPGHRAAVAVAECLRRAGDGVAGDSGRPVDGVAVGPGRPGDGASEGLGRPGDGAVGGLGRPGPAPVAAGLGDRIDLTGLTVSGRHGVHAWEKTTDQPFRVDVRAWLAPAPTGRADQLDQTVDYGRLAQALTASVSGPSVDLIETLAERSAQAVLALGGLQAVEVTVHKPEAPLAAVFEDVSVTVRRSADHPVGPASRVGAGRARRRAVFSLGSNLGDRAGWLQFGLAGLASADGLELVAASSVYQTAAVGPVEQDDFLNLVVLVDSDRSAEELLGRGLAIEAAAGRRRDVAHGPRNLDIDLIALDQATRHSPELTLPHPRVQERAFVLIPWLEVDPGARLDGRPLAEWLDRLGPQSVSRRDDLSLLAPLTARPEAGAGQGGSR